MSKREVIDCDGCNRENIQPIRIFLAVGTQQDPARGCTETRHEQFDLCHVCVESVMATLVEALSDEQQLGLAMKIRQRKGAYKAKKS